MTLAFKDIPNLISIARIILVWPVAYLLLEQRFSEALVLFFIAGVSDGLDGFLAKRFNWRSRLGTILDPLADKILLVTSFVCLVWVDIIPLWLMVIVFGRDLIIVLGATAFHLFVGSFDMVPTWISKINTTLQIVLVLALVLSHGLYTLPADLLTGLVYAVSLTTLLSGLDYVVTWGRKAIQMKKEH